MSKWTDIAAWRPTIHHGGAMDEVRGLVLHIAEGYYEGTIAWQHGDHDVSSHFVVGRDAGELAQLVDTDQTAWTQRSGNGHWLSLECAGFTSGNRLHKTHPGWEKLSDWQITTAASLLVRAHHAYGVPLQVTSSPGGRGLGHHSMGGPAWGHLDCPGAPIIAQKTTIVRLAQQIAGMVPAHPTLQLGAKNHAVTQLQRLINLVPDTGADVDVDGIYGTDTKHKVERVQRHFKITDDGVAGPRTWGKLEGK